MCIELGPLSIERAVAAVEKVRQRLLKSAAALNTAGVPYAVVGGNAVAVWVSRLDEAAVRNTQNVDVLIRRENLDAARRALESAGFVYRHIGGMDVFLDGPESKVRDAVQIVFASEKVREHEPVGNPDVTESEDAGAYRVVALEALVRIKLTAFRRKDQVHIADLMSVGLIDNTWPRRFDEPLRSRLQSILDTPDG